MRRDLHRLGLSQLTIWTGDDGPVALGDGSVGVEYRGRLGHPSSYGLLAAMPTHVKADDLSVRFQAQPSAPGEVVPPVDGDVVELGLHEPAYQEAIRNVARRTYTGLIVTAAVCGRIGSSVVVFTRLAAVLTTLVSTDAALIEEDRVWQTWDYAWPAQERQRAERPTLFGPHQ